MGISSVPPPPWGRHLSPSKLGAGGHSSCLGGREDTGAPGQSLPPCWQHCQSFLLWIAPFLQERKPGRCSCLLVAGRGLRGLAEAVSRRGWDGRGAHLGGEVRRGARAPLGPTRASDAPLGSFLPTSHPVASAARAPLSHPCPAGERDHVPREKTDTQGPQGVQPSVRVHAGQGASPQKPSPAAAFLHQCPAWDVYS